MNGLPYDQRDRNLGVLLHLSSFAGIILPYAGYVAPIVIWLVYKESGFVNRQGFIFFQWINFLYDLWHCERLTLFDSHRISTFVGRIHHGYLGTYQSSTCCPRWWVSRISSRNQVFPDGL